MSEERRGIRLHESPAVSFVSDVNSMLSDHAQKNELLAKVMELQALNRELIGALRLSNHALGVAGAHIDNERATASETAELRRAILNTMTCNRAALEKAGAS